MGQMMEYKGYRATIKYDSDDKIFVGKVFGINDSLNFHGNSVDELRESFHSCIENYLEMCKEFGCEPEKEYKGVFNVRVSPELHRKLALAAEEADMTLNQFVAGALEAAVSSEEPTERIVEYQTNMIFDLFRNKLINTSRYEDPTDVYRKVVHSSARAYG